MVVTSVIVFTIVIFPNGVRGRQTLVVALGVPVATEAQVEVAVRLVVNLAKGAVKSVVREEGPLEAQGLQVARWW